ncbi:hypothetical protein K9L67_02120 [Candidatus Woesearchaeota archaeon]|nr:hypothetical protein [Candidatus Woesearchaeota archaeon]MCF7901000.1 hypothetical protein [Candidatus Woesearchaeota archaeon]MCF8013284.1 hypothetical protein [Candidatus Woesearchaeota archaeon]
MLNLIRKKTQVILDTNFLIIPGELGIDIFSEIDRLMIEPYEICVLKESIKELETIINKHGQRKEGFNAKLGFLLAKQKNLKTLSGSKDKYVDEILVEIAKKQPEKTIIATQDKELQDRIIRKSARVIILRQKKYLEMR